MTGSLKNPVHFSHFKNKVKDLSLEIPVDVLLRWEMALDYTKSLIDIINSRIMILLQDFLTVLSNGLTHVGI